MKKCADAPIAIGALVLFAGWLFIGLPMIYAPEGAASRPLGEFLGVKYGEWLLFAATMGLWWATWRLVKSAEKTAERQLRAYVGLERGTVANLTGSGAVVATLAFKNAGQTPAYKLYTWGGMSVRPYPGPSSNLIPKHDPALIRETLILPSATFFRTEKGDIPENVKADIVAGRATLFVYGQIHYEDAFRRTRFVYFRYFCGGGHPNSITHESGVAVGWLVPHQAGNDAD